MAKTMRKLLLAAIAAVAVSASAHAERNRDILGLHPGMSYQEAMSAMAKVCQDRPHPLVPPESADEAISGVVCSLGERRVLDNGEYVMDNESLEVSFAVHVPQRTAYLVTDVFATNAETSDFVKSLFAQFGFPCESRPGYETCYPTRFDRASSAGGIDLLSVSLLLDPPTKIELMPTSGIRHRGLWLSLGMFTSEHRGVLELRDQELSDAENATREAKRRAPPKF